MRSLRWWQRFSGGTRKSPTWAHGDLGTCVSMDGIQVVGELERGMAEVRFLITEHVTCDIHHVWHQIARTEYAGLRCFKRKLRRMITLILLVESTQRKRYGQIEPCVPRGRDLGWYLMTKMFVLLQNGHHLRESGRNFALERRRTTVEHNVRLHVSFSDWE